LLIQSILLYAAVVDDLVIVQLDKPHSLSIALSVDSTPDEFQLAKIIFGTHLVL